MRCTTCGCPNPERLKFCTECGAPFRLQCEQCGFANPLRARFCGDCGFALAGGETGKREKNETESQDPSRWTPTHLAERIRAATLTEGERKTITALFADLKGSTALIEDLDPEEARAIIDPALQIMMDAVHRYEGYVAQALGDGIFALFGAPIAHEDHPQRALYAALRMQDEMHRYSDQIRLKHGVPLAIRIGINTGEVVLRSIRKEDLHTDYIPVGHATNLAARMEQMAVPGSILITEYTRKLVEGYFALKTLGAAVIKGRSEPLSVYEVRGVGSLHTRLQVAARRGLTRFVGRQRELDRLRMALDQATAGRGQIVGVSGEPGLGKSRLFHEFVGVTQASPLLVLHAYAVSHGKTSPYLPVIELLKSYFRIDSQDDERTRREKVTGKVLTLDRSLENTLPYLFALLGIEEPPPPFQQMDLQIRRTRTFAALKNLCLRESADRPLVLLFEDLQWIDSETQGFLDALSEGITSAQILLLVNYRPEYRHDWGQKAYYSQLRLAPFGRAEAEEFLDELLGNTVGGGIVPAQAGRLQESPLRDLKRLILEKTEGTPFFMEEIVQDLCEQGVLARDAVEGGLVPAHSEGVHKGVSLHIPTTVQGVLAARIDRLAPDEKGLLQQLAVIGREFPFGLVRQVIAQPEDELYRLLSSLQGKEFLYEQPAFTESAYVFKHALTQEVAYNSVLIERRKGLHEQTGHAIEQLYPNRLEEHYNELAHHYRRSGNIEKAIEYLQKAGQQTAQNSAHTEAINHFTAALDLLLTLADSPGRRRQELTLQLLLAASLQVTKGPSALEVGNAYTRARALCEQEGDAREFFAVLRGLWLFHHVQANLAAARETGEQLLDMAEYLHDSALLVEARRTLGSTLLWQGDFPLARIHLEEAVALYEQQQPGPLNLLYGGAEPGVVCFCELARVLWFLGYPDLALRRSRAALALARSSSNFFNLSFALIFAAGLHQLRREGQLTQSYAEDGIVLAREHGFTALLSAGTIRRGWALAEQGRAGEGLRLMQQGLTDRQATGAELAQPYFLALQAEVSGKLGQIEPALILLSEALAAMSTSGEHRLEAELHRFKGELTLQTQSVVSRQLSVLSPQSLTPNTQTEVEREAENCFLKAIGVAQKQHAKSLELRAATSLARLWQQQGKLAKARELLAPVYHWFTEGFDTKDLQEAQALLETLS
ncbi:MAG: adenylate/guanylate cyclase domain-containing protein [Candidatus Binatia bacterium]